MDALLKERFEAHIKVLTGFQFQTFVIEVFRTKYGVTGFTDIRLRKDKGCDGIVEGEKRIIACFGPEENTSTTKRQKDFKKKAKEDFDAYCKHWKPTYPFWSVVINHRIDPVYDTTVKSLYPNASIIGSSQLVATLEGLNNSDIRRLGRSLGIPKELFASDFIGEILDDLLKEEPAGVDPTYNPKTLVEITEKIRLNFSGKDIDAINEEYENLLLEGIFLTINSLFFAYDDDEIKRIKKRVIYEYGRTSGDLKKRLNDMTEIYLARYASETDDNYLYYIRGLLIYLFEQCLIGDKTDKEK